jgi:TatA/E family protein of Tat protein translocase
MQAMTENGLMLALFSLGGGEIILILALVLILFGAKKLPELGQGLRRGFFEFRKAVDDEASDAGRSLGGIYGKPAAQALTPDNQVAEIYEPGAFEEKTHSPRHRKIITRSLQRLRWWVRRIVQRL